MAWILVEFRRNLAPGHVADLERYRARGYAMKGNRIAIVTDRPMETVEVHMPSVNAVNMAGITVGYYPPRPLPTA